MKIDNIVYRLFCNDNIYDIIYLIIKETDNDFIPKLSDKYKLEEIAEKYIKYSHCIIAYVNDEPAGLAAFYPNPKPNTSYFSLLSVRKKFRGYQIGRNLEIKCIEYCRKIDSLGLDLTMRKSNTTLFQKRLEFGYQVLREYKSPHADLVVVDMFLDFKLDHHTRILKIN